MARRRGRLRGGCRSWYIEVAVFLSSTLLSVSDKHYDRALGNVSANFPFSGPGCGERRRSWRNGTHSLSPSNVDAGRRSTVTLSGSTGPE